MKEQTHAQMVCNRSGVVKIVGWRDIPDGWLPVVRGRKEEIDEIKGFLRLAYDNETYLVPGIPEAPTVDAAIDALVTFRKRLASMGYDA